MNGDNNNINNTCSDALATQGRVINTVQGLSNAFPSYAPNTH